jgi:dipeptidyl aminopeptidase/acylaminoacyl peptidase
VNPVRSFSVDDLKLHEAVVDFRLSPDGTEIVLELKKLDVENDAYRSELWLLPLGGGPPLQWVREGSSNRMPSWSPDGNQLVFVSNRRGPVPQLFVIDRGGGEARPLAQLDHAPTSPVFSPDGKTILCSSAVDVEARPKHVSVSVWKNRPRHVVKQRFKSDGMGFLLDSHTQLFAVPADGGEAKQLTQGDTDCLGPSWSPDGSKIAWCRSRPGPHSGNLSDVWVAKADGSDARQVTSEVPTAMHVAWAPDGQTLVFEGTREPGDSMSVLWKLSLATGKVGRLGDGGLLVASYPMQRGSPVRFSPDGQHVWAVRGEQGVSAVVALDLETGEEKVHLAGERQVSAFDLQHGVVAFTGCTADRPDTLWVADSQGHEKGPVWSANAQWWDRREQPKAEHRKFTLKDGTNVWGWVLRPANGAEHAPLLVDVHGGPHSWVSLGFDYHPYWQALIARGWVVLALDAVGSATYGWDFAEKLRGHWGEADLPQHLEAVDQLQAEGLAGEQVAICGKSYGGYLSAYAIGQTRRFKAAVVSAPVANLESHAGTSDSGYYVGPWDQNAELHEAREKFRRLSPVQHAHRAETPTLILQGEDDQRCPRGQSEELFSILMRQKKAPVELVLFPGGDHHVAEEAPPSQRLHYHQQIVDWLEKWCGHG